VQAHAIALDRQGRKEAEHGVSISAK